MKTPGFWYRPPGAAALLLAPAAALYARIGAARRRTIPSRRAPVPVVCVGNLTAGGAGKTPVAAALAGLLRDYAPHIVSRGYGGRSHGPVQVDPDRHSAAEVGDEALLLAEAAPCWVARDRVAGAEAAAAAGAGLILLDDGFQNPALAKDASLVVVDGRAGFGNGRVMPAGPLRERVAEGLARADAVIVMGPDDAGIAAQVAPVPTLRARLEPLDGAALRGVRVLAFAGIGLPEKFFRTLEETGAVLVDRVAFPDHHPYGGDELRRLAARAGDARLVTTAKDWVRLPPEFRAAVAPLRVRAVFDDEAALRRLLDAKLSKARRAAA